MGIAQDFAYAPVHTHINLVGFVTLFLLDSITGRARKCGGAAPREPVPLRRIAGAILLPIGIFGAVTGRETMDLAVIPGRRLLTLASMVLFLAIVLRGWRRHAATEPRSLMAVARPSA